MRRPILASVLVAAAALLVTGVPSQAATPASHPTSALTFGANTYAYTASYGEPGLAISPKDGAVYATTPGDGGAVLARSDDKGAHWTKLATTRPTAVLGSETGGSDSDVAVAKDGTVYTADLEVTGITVFRSTDKGVSFPQQVFITSTSDREWLAVDGPHGEDVYLVWHEIGTGTMLAATSHDRGATFSLPTVIYSNPQTVAESAHNGTSIGSVSTDGLGRVYVSYATTRLTTTDTTYGSPPLSAVHMSISSDKGATWHDVTINPGADDANYGNFWQASAVDRGGDVYAVYSGYAHKGQPMRVWLQQSVDHGEHWSVPYAVDSALPGATGQNLFGWVAGGAKGVAVVSWYHTTAADKDAAGIDWTVPVAQVRGLETGHPSVVVGLASDHSVHHGPICTLGTFCGILPGSSSDRTLLDFFKVAVGPDGIPAVVWSDNNRTGAVKTGVGFARQTSGPNAFSSTVGGR